MDAHAGSTVRAPLTVERLLVLSLAVLVGAAGVVHLDAAGKHFEHPVLAAAFIVMGGAQLALTGGVLQRPSRVLFVLIALVSWTIVCLWCATRVTAVPSIGGLETVEPVGVPDTIATGLEVLAVVAVGALLVLSSANLSEIVPSRALTATATAVLVLMAVAVAAPHDHDHLHSHGVLAASAGELADFDAHEAGGHSHGAKLARSRARAPADGDHVHADAPLTFEEAEAVLVGHHHELSGGAHTHPDSAAGHGDVATHEHEATHDHSGSPASGHSHSAAHRQERVILQDSSGKFGGGEITYEPATPDGKHGADIRGHNAAMDRQHAEMHAVNKPCTPTAKQHRIADRLLRDSRAAIKKYDNNPARALADGFIAYPIPLSKMFHMVSPARVRDSYELTPSKVESFMYAMTDSGLKAVGVMYMFDPRDEVPPNPTGCILQWHRHIGTAGLVTSFDPQHPYASAWMAHIWTFGYDDPWHDGDGTEPHTWFFGYRYIPNVCDSTGQCI